MASEYESSDSQYGGSTESTESPPLSSRLSSESESSESQYGGSTESTESPPLSESSDDQYGGPTPRVNFVSRLKEGLGSPPRTKSYSRRNQQPGPVKNQQPGLRKASRHHNYSSFPSSLRAFRDLTKVSSPHAESSSIRDHRPYHVFINHYGKDTKETLAKTLYEKLGATGIRVFRDKDELRFGDFFPETLEKAIHSASLYIAIFSENYAQSPWCLAELELMLQLVGPGHKFIPIFYDVEPYILRWTIEGKGIYENAFKEYEMKKRYSAEKLKNWKSALHKASFYTGHIIAKEWCWRSIDTWRPTTHLKATLYFYFL